MTAVKNGVTVELSALEPPGDAMNSPRPEDVVFVGDDPESDDDHCPAVFIDPVTGDFLFQGRIITDPAVMAMVREHGAIAADEAVVWLPARMRQAVEDALRGFDDKRQGHGEPTVRSLLARASRSAVHLEMRDLYLPSPGFDDWKAGGDGRTDRSGWVAAVEDAVSRGVRVRRARVVSEPVSNYTRWLHMVTDVNLKAGEEVRWVSRRRVFDLMLPGADLWMFDQRVVLYNFNSGEGDHVPGYEYTSDPRHVAQVVAAFEQVWERATPHEAFKV